MAVTISVPKRWGCGSPVDFFEIIAPDEVLILRFKYPCAGCKYIIIRYLRNVDDDDEHESSAEIATHGQGFSSFTETWRQCIIGVPSA